MKSAVRPLIYIHGYNSSPDSAKAQLTADWLAREHPQHPLFIPRLPMIPSAAMATLDELFNELHGGLVASAAAGALAPAIIGSSMGGFYANCLAEKYGARAVLINPAVYPHRLLAAYIGAQTNPQTGETYTLTKQHMVELQALLVQSMAQPQQRMVLLQTGDETLDYSEAQHYYAHSDCHIERGGDHSFTTYEQWLPRIAQFLQLS